MLSRHRFCCYIVFAQRVTLMLVRVSHFTHYPTITLAYIDYFYLQYALASIAVDFGPMCSNLGNRMIFFFNLFIYFLCFFLSLLLQCKFVNSTLLSLLSFSYFITPYDAQASSAFSALIIFTEPNIQPSKDNNNPL